MKRLIEFFTDTIFRKEFHSRHVRWLARQYKLLFYTVRGLSEHGTVVRCAALTFYTIISIVPILALVFAVLKGFGMIDGLIANLYSVFPNNPEIVDYIVAFAAKALENTRGGVVAIFGIVMLFWAVIRVFGSIESAFNNIWEVKSGRSLVRQYVDYIALIVVVPILWVGLDWLASYARTNVGNSAALEWVGIIGSWVVPCLVFALLYYAIPNTKVRPASALMAGVIAGLAFMVFQWAYITLQHFMTSYNTIYGSFAALPLFLLWVQTSWEILLLGGELSFAYQNIGRFDEERESLGVSDDARRKIAVAVMCVVVQRVHAKCGAVYIEEVRDRLHLPVRLLNSVIYALADAQLLAVSGSKDDDRGKFLSLTADPDTLTVEGVQQAVESYGKSNIALDSKAMRSVEAVVEQLKNEAAESAANLKISQIEI